MIHRQFRFFILSLISVILAFQFSLRTASSQTALTRAQVLEDGKTTENLLKKYHPNLYAHRTPKQINRIWSKARSQVPENPNFLDAATLAQKILAAVCDGHTLVRLNEGWISDNWIYTNRKINGFFPENLVIIDEELYLDNAQFDQKSRKIVSINKRTSGEIIDFTRSITAADGCQNSNVLFTHLMIGRLTMSILLANFLGQGPNFKITYKNAKTGATTTSNLRQMSLSRLRLRSKYRSMRGRSFVLKSLGITSNERAWEFAFDGASQAMFRSNAKKSIYYIYLPSFDGAKAQSKYFDDQLRALVKANPDHVIVDLTDNPGGWQWNAQQFMSYFLHTSSRFGTSIRSRIKKNISDSNYVWYDKKHREWCSKHVSQYKRVRKSGRFYRLNETPRSFGNTSYKGKLTVLVSPKTGSAATTVATILKRKVGATIVGNIGDASMKSTCSSSPGAHLLPNSGTAILVPLVCGDRHPEARRKGNLLRPDIPVDIAKQNSRMTNAIILGEAIEALNLREFAGLKNTKPSARDAGRSQPQKRRDFEASKRTVRLTLSEHPIKRGRAWIGISTANVAEFDVGAPEFGKGPAVLITKVYPGSPADRSGLKAGDILLFVHGAEIKDIDEVVKAVSYHRPDNQISVKIVTPADTTNELVAILRSRLDSPEDRKLAAFILGCLYVSGDFGPAKRQDSVRLLNMASEAGSADATTLLGHLYSGSKKLSIHTGDNLIVVWNSKKAMDYYSRAAALGDQRIMFQLAQLYGRRRVIGPGIKFFDRKEIDSDAELAARYLLHAYQKRNQDARDSLFVTPQHHWSGAVRIAVKKLLHDLGIFKGKLDDRIGQDSRKAIVRLRAEPIELPELPAKPPR